MKIRLGSTACLLFDRGKAVRAQAPRRIRKKSSSRPLRKVRVPHPDARRGEAVRIGCTRQISGRSRTRDHIHFCGVERTPYSCGGPYGEDKMPARLWGRARNCLESGLRSRLWRCARGDTRVKACFRDEPPISTTINRTRMWMSRPDTYDTVRVFANACGEQQRQGGDFRGSVIRVLYIGEASFDFAVRRSRPPAPRRR